MSVLTILLIVVVILTVLVVGFLIGASLTDRWMSKRIHTVGAERRDLSDERADIVGAWTELAEQRRELDALRSEVAQIRDRPDR